MAPFDIVKWSFELDDKLTEPTAHQYAKRSRPCAIIGFSVGQQKKEVMMPSLPACKRNIKTYSESGQHELCHDLIDPSVLAMDKVCRLFDACVLQLRRHLAARFGCTLCGASAIQLLCKHLLHDRWERRWQRQRAFFRCCTCAPSCCNGLRHEIGEGVFQQLLYLKVGMTSNVP